MLRCMDGVLSMTKGVRFVPETMCLMANLFITLPLTCLDNSLVFMMSLTLWQPALLKGVIPLLIAGAIRTSVYILRPLYTSSVASRGYGWIFKEKGVNTKVHTNLQFYIFRTILNKFLFLHLASLEHLEHVVKVFA